MLLPYMQRKRLEAGCDEAGRGCLAGPVFAAAVILPKKFYHPLLNDSKQVKPEDRAALKIYIQKHALCFAVASVDHEEIDRINILKASIKAMHIALDQLTQRPTAILIDGNYFISYSDIPHQCVIQGDGIYASIAAASILAKTYRDEYMQQLHENYPEYGWKTNKGYATIQHRHALASFGPSPFHRKSFNWQTEQLEFEF